jgi:putative SOS response-associated peptidase YedK
MFAVAGLWRPTAEWGHAYTMVMSDACEQMADVHDRMPVILTPDQFEHWQHGSEDDALALARTCDLELAVERTEALWVSGETPAQKSLL